MAVLETAVLPLNERRKLAPHSGFEPETTRLTVSFPYRQGPYGMERMTRIERATDCLEGSDSTTELHPRYLVPGPRVEREPSALQADVRANYTNRATVAGLVIETRKHRL